MLTAPKILQSDIPSAAFLVELRSDVPIPEPFGSPIAVPEHRKEKLYHLL